MSYVCCCEQQIEYMITIISGTNRANSLTAKFAEQYGSLLSQHEACLLFTLADLPVEVLNLDVYEKGKKSQKIIELQEKYFFNAEKFVFVFPEYNGSFPGILKVLIDVLDPKLCFGGKKAGLIGLATGRAGNLRGLDHMTSVLNHMNTSVMPYLLPVSRVQFEFEEDGTFKEGTLKLVQQHLDKMLVF